MRRSIRISIRISRLLKPTRPLLLIPNQFYTTLKASYYSSYEPLHFVGQGTISIANALTFSSNSKSPILGTQIHGHVIQLGFSNEVITQNNLINMYTRCGYFSEGLEVFDEMPERNLVSWTLVMSGAILNSEYDMGFEAYLGMTRSGLTPNEFALGSLMKVCTSMEVYGLGLCIHCFALKIGMERNSFVGCAVIHMYAKFGVIEAAERVFECMESCDVGCWNAMIGGYAQNCCGSTAIETVSSMHSRGLSMDEFTFINSLSGCVVTGDLHFGRQIHGLIVRSGNISSTSVINALMDMYFKNGSKDHAFRIFNAMQVRDLVSWNTVFAGISQYNDATKVASAFHDFMLSGLKPNHVTFSVLFRLFGEVSYLHLGLQFCCLALKFGFLGESHVATSLISMFSRCEAKEMARFVFDHVPSKDINQWNEMIAGYNLTSDIEALKLFRELRNLGSDVDGSTFSTALEASFKAENPHMARQIHGIVIKSGFSFNLYVCNSLIEFYVMLGLLNHSFEFFTGLEELDLACWSIMISTLVHEGHYSEAIRFFKFMKENGEVPDEFILGSILNCSAILASYYLTKSIHSLVIKMGIRTPVVASATLDAYAKCGDIESAKITFQESSKSVDVVLYNAMILALACQGLVTEAMEIFGKMKEANIKPNQSTFVSVLTACSHMGLVDLGRMLFESISLEYGMEPSADNYGCLVDLLARTGFLEDAKHIIEVMPFPSWPGVLRSFLNGCRIHGKKEMGEWVAKWLVYLFPDNDAAYVLLSKVYSEDGNWEDAVRLRKRMVERGVQKDSGYSWIEA